MQYSSLQNGLTSSISLLLILLFTLLVLQWGTWFEHRSQLPSTVAFSPTQLPLKQPWWVKIQTTEPPCLYYFGPFRWQWLALRHRRGYCEDLLQERAQGLEVAVVQAQPEQLTDFQGTMDDWELHGS
ncbi:MAG: DUF1816 domain-containing protein [Synechococcales cyanobacterium RM1_1_8]|nr:DUF1816 domain-containing protein [Synechococcales cyanobacterium RM1_1_8]